MAAGKLPVQATLRASAENGYYRTPVLKRPQWTVEVPLHFFKEAWLAPLP
jgi:hypothetical protein